MKYRNNNCIVVSLTISLLSILLVIHPILLFQAIVLFLELSISDLEAFQPLSISFTRAETWNVHATTSKEIQLFINKRLIIHWLHQHRYYAKKKKKSNFLFYFFLMTLKHTTCQLINHFCLECNLQRLAGNTMTIPS